MGNLTGWHFLILLVVILLMFGAPKLPGLAKSLAESLKIFRSGMAPSKDDEPKTKPKSTE
jgi:sec-independent protein translocase protein TatA